MPSPAISGELVGQSLGKYELLALIAVGGTAEIYLARISGASGFEKYLVVKCLLDHLADDQEFVRMFLDEARISAQLDHSNIVQTLELGEHNGRYFLVMEYLAGMSVAQLARKTQERGINGGLISPNLVLGLAAQTCSGLHYAHSKTLHGKSLNLVHRDISPQNLVVSYEGILKIVDFGIAKSDIREVQTRTGTIKGKFAYMSPEQCLAKEVDQRTDIFALGTLCHELLTGRRLFKRQTTYDTYQAIVNGNVPPPSKLNPKLDSRVDKTIMKALAYKPENRYPNAQAFGEAILELLHLRAGSGGSGEIARFFDDHFHEDLDAHAAQMRELITGRRGSVPDGTWDSDIEPPDQEDARPIRPLGGKSLIPKPPGASSIPKILPQAPDPNVDASEDDEGPTRIEFNPADRIAAVHEENSNIDQGWDEPQTIKPGRREAASNLQAAELGADPIEAAEMQRGTSGGGPMPPVPSSMTPSSGTEDGSHSSEFATPPETIDVTDLPRHANPMLAPQGQDASLQRRAQSGHTTLQGQQATHVPPHQSHSQPRSAMQAPMPSTRPVMGAMPESGVNYRGGNHFSTTERMMSRPTTGRPASRIGGQGSVPLWMHAAVFAVFVGLGIGIAAFIRLVF